jgi:ABC-2 type transport system ATP-binding protein
MQSTTRTFSYTVQRGPYISTISALLFLMTGETGGITFLIARFLSIGVLKWVIAGAFVAFYLFIAGKLLMPLWTKHRLSAAYLQLHFGVDFKARIPRTSIVAIERARERVVMPMARYEAEKQRLNIAFSEHGQLLLSLDKPYSFQVGLGKKAFAEKILLNVNQPDELLSALKPVESAVVEPAPRIEEPVMEHRPLHLLPVTQTRPDNSAQTLAIRALQLTRRYKQVTAVDGLDLAVQRGEIYGFLGANGAGKTTTMKMLVGLLQPDAGHVWIDGHDMWSKSESLAAKAALGYVADRAMLYERLTGREFLAFLAQLRGIPRQEAHERIEQLLALLDLEEQAESVCGAYSFGMKRKLALAGALVHHPSVLILDEPLNGLDPLSARRLKDLFSELASGGTTIFLSTHDLATAESICHRVGIIQHGRLLVEGSAAELRQLATASNLEDVFLTLTGREEEARV